MCDPQTFLQHVGSFQLLKHHLGAQHHLGGRFNVLQLLQQHSQQEQNKSKQNSTGLP
jgi:hypothetical protein